MCREGHGGWGLALLDALEFWLDILHIIVMGLFCLFDGQPGKCHGAMSCPRVSNLWPCGVGYHFVKLNKPSLTFFLLNLLWRCLWLDPPIISILRQDLNEKPLSNLTIFQSFFPFLVFEWKTFFLLKKDTTKLDFLSYVVIRSQCTKLWHLAILPNQHLFQSVEFKFKNKLRE